MSQDRELKWGGASIARRDQYPCFPGIYAAPAIFTWQPQWSPRFPIPPGHPLAYPTPMPTATPQTHGIASGVQSISTRTSGGIAASLALEGSGGAIVRMISETINPLALVHGG